MGEIAERLSDIAIVTSDNPRCEVPMDIIEDILQGMRKDNHIVIENRKEAIGYALNIAKPGDVILLAGKGHETYQILPDETIYFSDKETILEALS